MNSPLIALFAFALVGVVSANEALGLPKCVFPLKTQESQAKILQNVSPEKNRPQSSQVIASPSLPILLHIQEGVELDYAGEILALSEMAWQKLFFEMGFLPPHTDGQLGGDERFDIYIVTDLDPGIGGYAGFSGYNEETPRADAVGYLVINNAMGALYRPFVVAHELFHASQMAYDWWEDLGFMEASATWVPDLVFPEDNLYWRYFPFYNAEPYLALDYISLKSPYQYGMGMFVMYLDEKFGSGDGSFIKTIWEQSVQNDIVNEPDFLDVIHNTTVRGLDQAFIDFGPWRFFVGSRDDSQHFSDGAVWDERMDPYFEVEAPKGALILKGEAVKPLEPYSHAFLRFPRPPGEIADYSLELYSADQNLNLQVTLLEQRDGLWQQRVGEISRDGRASLQVRNNGTLAEFVAIVANLGDGTYDSDTSPWTKSSLAYDFRVLMPLE
jgi:hypothetical protein